MLPRDILLGPALVPSIPQTAALQQMQGQLKAARAEYAVQARVVAAGGGPDQAVASSLASVKLQLKSHTHELNRDVRTVRAARECVRWRTAELERFGRAVAAGAAGAEAAPEGGWLATWAELEQVSSVTRVLRSSWAGGEAAQLLRSFSPLTSSER